MINPRNLNTPARANQGIPHQSWGNLKWFGGSIPYTDQDQADNANMLVSLVIPFSFKLMAVMYKPASTDATGTGMDFGVDLRKLADSNMGFSADWEELSVDDASGALFADLSGGPDSDGSPVDAPYDSAATFTVMRVTNEGAYTNVPKYVYFAIGVMPY